MSADNAKDIPGLLGYRADEHGKIYSLWTHGRGAAPKAPGRELKQYISTTGYLYVRPRTANGVQVFRTVHDLVLTAFVGPRPSGCDGCHVDGNRRNNCLANLRWGTRKSNEADKIAHGTKMMGEKVHCAKLTTLDVAVIKGRLAAGCLQKALAREFGVSPQTITDIKNGRVWTHVLPEAKTA